MASLSEGVPVGASKPVARGKDMLDRYFYLGAALLIAAIVVTGFSRTVNQNLFHPALPRPFLLWIHGAAFAGWVVFYIVQAALIRTRNVKLHRRLGWVGAGLGAVMVPLGLTISVVMGHFDAVRLHQPDPAFLSIPFYDMIAFAMLLSLAIYWRRKPEFHRRLLFVATCCLLDAAFGRWDFVFSHGLFYVCLDLVILLGVLRDLIVNRRVHAVYLYALPMLVLGQTLAIYLWRGSPAWWLNLTKSVQGLS